MAAQVQAETIPEAISPDLTDLDAEENSSLLEASIPVYLFWRKEIPTITRENPSPKAMTVAHPALFKGAEGERVVSRQNRMRVIVAISKLPEEEQGTF